MEYNEISDSEAAHGNKWRNARAGGHKNGGTIRTVECKIPMGARNAEGGTDFCIGKNWGKTAPGNIINTQHKGWVVRCGKQRIVSFHRFMNETNRLAGFKLQ